MKCRLISFFTLLWLTGLLLLPASAVEPSSFSDVDSGASYARAIHWAAEQGYISGYPDGRFGVNDPVTRAQLTAIFYRAAGSPTTSSGDYTDESMIAAYAQAAADWAHFNHIMTAREDGRFAPNDNATRTEVVSALYQYMNLSSDEPEKSEMLQLQIEAGGQIFAVTLADNPTTRALLERLPMTISIGELNGNEKYYYMSDRLPTDPYRPGTIHAGDLMLYGADCLVLFYESFSSGYSYTSLGRVDDPAGLAAALGRGSIEVTLRVR